MKLRRSFIICVALVLVIALSGCGKVSEFSKEMKEVKKSVDAVTELAKNADVFEKLEAVELTEENLAKYYKFLEKAESEYQDVGFENPTLAIVLFTQQTGKKLDNYVDKSGIIGFEEYAGVAISILQTKMEMAGVGMLRDALPSMQAGLEKLEELKTDETLSKEKKEEILLEIEKMKKGIAESEAKLDSEEFKKIIELNKMIDEKREGTGI